MDEEYRISEETAKKELQRILDYYDAEINDSFSDEAQERIIKGFRRGDFEIMDDEVKGFCVKQNLKKGEPLIYREVMGKDKIEVALNTAENQPYLMIYTFLGKLSGYGKDAIMKLSGRDLKNAEAIAALFFIC